MPAAPSRSPSASPKKRKLDDTPLPPLLSRDEVELCTTLARTPIPFSLDEAQAHLCKVDVRFVPLFKRYPLRVYANSDTPLNLYRTIIRSILGQQISWLAAQSIMHKFLRLFNAELPEELGDTEWFPSPLDVLDADDTQLRTAGLSSAKIVYVRDVSRRFADGRFDVRKLSKMSADEVIAALTEARGVGRWTAEMMLMFALRHPDVLPTGDLGVQRGMLSFFLACLCGPKMTDEETLECTCSSPAPLPLPTDAISHKTLVSRSEGNKTAKKMYLDADEMHSLADAWAPYRAVGTMFMWQVR
ncbi:DNA-3-methyladenine glycosylase II [Malassezia cuniculi]|uniref:DNA-3-methyladenine glycosylase II n=1 Tax=Malassezia cuniculi TaxID=948313 RepID=A0AAF0EUR0_9BASI|nr:DNA-3-methyladenine glycosylase II [Malassezia cuniculi]